MEFFDFSNPPIDPTQLAIDLTETMLANEGIGLAANQVGLPYRVFAMAGNPVLVCFNPRIVHYSDDKIIKEEGCLSFPGLELKIKRPLTIRARFTLPNGETQTHIYTGLTSRIFQHELDHLDGILFTERAGPVTLAMAKAKLKKSIL